MMTSSQAGSPPSEPNPASSPAPGWRRWWPFKGNRKVGADEVKESYRRLSMQLDLEFSGREGGSCIMLTSPRRGETCLEPTLELAWFLAEERGHKVLIVDASLQDREVTKAFNAHEAGGLLDYLARVDEPANGLMRKTEHVRVSFLPVGQAKPGETGTLNTRNIGACLDHLRSDYDFILIHAPAVLVESSTLAFPGLMDGVLLLAIEGESRLDELASSRETLEACKAPKVGLVLTVPSSKRSTKSGGGLRG